MKIGKGGRWKIENGRRKTYKMRRGPFFFFFAFHFSMKTTEIFLGLPKCEFSTCKKAFYTGEKNQEK